MNEKETRRDSPWKLPFESVNCLEPSLSLETHNAPEIISMRKQIKEIRI